MAVRGNSVILPTISLLLLPICVGGSSAASATALHDDFWFTAPAQRDGWNADTIGAALPVGNGRLGALVYGGINHEILRINEDSIWKKSYYNSTINPASGDTVGCVTAVRGLLAEEQYGDAEELAECLMGHPDGSTAPASVGSLLSPYQPLMDLAINFTLKGAQAAAEGTYTRGLNLSSGVASVVYDSSAATMTTHRRAIFAPAQDNVLVVWLQKAGDQKISLSIMLNRTGTGSDQAAVSASKASQQQLDLVGSLNHPDGSSYLAFSGSVRIVADGASASVAIHGGTTLHVKDADAVTILVGAASNFDDRNLRPRGIQKLVDQALDAAEKKGAAAMLADHTAAFAEIAGRASVSFGAANAPPPARAALPTDQRLAAARAHGADGDLSLLPLLFKFGRYLLASSSNPASGAHPANLQGVWNAAMAPPWNAEYTTNINLEMNYWHSEVASLQDMTPPLLAFVKRLAASGAETARVLYNASGWCEHHDTTLWVETVPIDGVQWGMWPYGGAWLTRQLFEHYLFGSSGGVTYLEEIYPLLAGASEFVLDYLSADPRYPGKLLSGPTVSPENTFVAPKTPGSGGGGGGEHYLSMGTTIDHEVIRDLFNNTWRAAKVLGRDGSGSLQERLEKAVARLPARRRSKRYGMLQEWLEDYEEAQPDMRHFSPVYGLFPAALYDPHVDNTTSGWAQALIEHRLAHIDRGNFEGWSDAWVASLWSRLGRGDMAYAQLNTWLLDVGGNGFDHIHDPSTVMQIDGNFGATAAIAEMLMQSHRMPDHGLLLLLPALPSAWSAGSFEGLRARGGYTLRMRWAAGKVEALAIVHTSEVDFGDVPLPLLIRLPASFDVPAAVSVRAAGSPAPVTCFTRPKGQGGLEIRFEHGCLQTQTKGGYEIDLSY